MANTFSASLVQDTVSTAGMTSLGPVLDATGKFSFNVGVDPINKTGSVHVPITVSTSAALTNPTNYAAGDTTVESREVTVNEYAKSFHITQAQANEGKGLAQLIGKNMQTIANQAQDIIYAPLTVSNFGAASLDVTAAAFDPATDLKTVWKAGKDFPTKNLVLEGDWYGELVPTSNDNFRLGSQGAYGFDSIALNNRWDGAGANVIGFLGAADSLAIASGEPAIDSTVQDGMEQYFEVPLANGISVYFAMWVDINSRTRWASLGLMLGSGPGDTTAGTLITAGV
jgi:hypothetical protein